MDSAPVVGVAAVAVTLGIFLLILFDFMPELWVASPAWLKLVLACSIVIVSIVVIASR